MKSASKSFLFLVLLIISGCSLDDSILSESSIEGVVKNTAGEVLSNASVELVTADGSLFTSTDQSGHYYLKNIPYGIAILKFRYEEYYDIEKKITFNETQAKTMNITLRRFLDDYFLRFAPQSISLKNTDTKAELNVSTNAGFQVFTDASWITLTPTEAPKSSKISITCTPNNEPILREAEIIITGDYGIEERVMVIQQPGPISSTEGSKFYIFETDLLISATIQP